MPLPDQSPQLPKWPFLLGDAALLAAAWVIAAGAAHPLRGEAIIAIVACVACAGAAGVLPFLADYARRQDEALDHRQRALEALARTVATAAEQISIAASGLNEIAELAQKNLRQAEKIPAQTMEKIAQFDAQIAASRAEEKKTFEKDIAALRSSETRRLESAVEKIARAAADWSRLSAPPAPSRGEAGASGSGRGEIPANESMAQASAESPAGAGGVEAAEPESALGATRSTLDRSAAIAEETVLAADRPAARKRAPKKAPKDAPAKLPLTEDGDLSAKLDLGEIEHPDAPAKAPGTEEYSQAAPDEATPAVSADGATRLLITAYIGIGNRLFIRGDGPGLSWDKGVPLQFVSIGKWRWDTAEATEAVKFKLYKNDEIECSALGSRMLEPGHQLEVTATF